MGTISGSVEVGSNQVFTIPVGSAAFPYGGAIAFSLVTAAGTVIATATSFEAQVFRVDGTRKKMLCLGEIYET